MNQHHQATQHNKLFRDHEEDRKTFTTILAFVYSPLVLLLGAAAFLA